jgi:hypothetical protein
MHKWSTWLDRLEASLRQEIALQTGQGIAALIRHQPAASPEELPSWEDPEVDPAGLTGFSRLLWEHKYGHMAGAGEDPCTAG